MFTGLMLTLTGVGMWVSLPRCVDPTDYWYWCEELPSGD